jgi:quercetin dioxygenase-like cupin family protein
MITDLPTIVSNDAKSTGRDMWKFSLPPEKAAYMMGRLEDLTSANIARWIDHSVHCQRLELQGYQIFTQEREVSLVTGEPGAYLPPHIHEQSDALLLITGGSANFISYTQDSVVLNGDGSNLFRNGLEVISQQTNDQGHITRFRCADGPVVTDVTAQSVREGDMILVPRRMPHGFKVSPDVGCLQFISVQSPPIHDELTNTFDFLSIETDLNRLISKIIK